MSWWNVGKLAVTAVSSYAGSKKSKGSDGSGGAAGGAAGDQIDVAKIIKDTAKAYKDSASDVIATEEELRPAMRKWPCLVVIPQQERH